MGINPVKTIIQVDSMDSDLKNGLWNCLSLRYWEKVTSEHYHYDGDMQSLVQSLWLNYFKKPIDGMPRRWTDILAEIRKYFFSATWDGVYDFIEFIAQAYKRDYTNNEFIRACNIILQREVSAYRFVGDQITKITSEEEINAIEQGLNKSTPLRPVHMHLQTALDFLSDRKSPDYRNSIKESISAVEAICRLITGVPKATLGEAIKKLKDSKVEIHPALEKAFFAMYGYTSDKSGIRHALMDESNLKFIDAKFMLVSCSTFISLLIDKASESGIKF